MNMLSTSKGDRGTLSGGGGLAVGIAIGVALGAAMDNMGAGIAIGIAVGVALGAAQRGRKPSVGPTDQDDPGPKRG